MTGTREKVCLIAKSPGVFAALNMIVKIILIIKNNINKLDNIKDI